MEFINPNLLKEVFRFSVFRIADSECGCSSARQVLGNSAKHIRID